MGGGEQAAGGGARKNDDRIRGSTIGVTISPFLSKNRELLEINFFVSPNLFGELANNKFGEKIWRTLEDAK